MKNKYLTLMVLMIFLGSDLFAQVNTSALNALSAKEFDTQIQLYLKKSKRQKTLGWIFLGGGFGGTIIFSAVADNSNNFERDGTGLEVLSGLSSLSTLASIPLFFASSRNRNEAQLVMFRKEVFLAKSDSSRRNIISEAEDYFSGKARSNKTAGIVLTCVGAASIIAGVAMIGGRNNDPEDFFLGGDDLYGSLFIAGGIGYGLLSIPFYVRAAKLKGTSKTISRTGRIPQVRILTLTPSIGAGAGHQITAGVIMKW